MPKESENIGETPADKAIDWLVLMRSGAVGAKDRRAFEHWLQEDAAHREAYAEAEAMWTSTARALKQSHYEPISTSRPVPVKNVASCAWRPGLAMAAAVLIGVVLSWTALTPRLLSDYSTRSGEQKQIVLADGSRVLLNTDTAMALDWSADRRRIVLLKGQAEFTVAKDSRPAFVVEAGDLSVRALGTIFEVYKEATGAVNVSVSEHAVAVGLQNAGAGELRVEQGQLLHYGGKGALNKPANADLHWINAWTRGKLIFRDRPLAEVVAELNRYSKARIMLQGERVENLRVSGVFPVDGRLVLEALEKSFSLQALHLGPWLVILH